MNSDTGAELLYLDQQLCFKLYTASRLMTRAYQPMLKALEITYPQYLVLMVLWEQADKGQAELTLGDLGQRLQLDSGTLTPLLKRLQAAGVVERQRNAEDERQLLVSLTAEGFKKRAKAAEWVAEQLGGDRVSASLVNDLQANLQEFVDAFN